MPTPQSAGVESSCEPEWTDCVEAFAALSGTHRIVLALPQGYEAQVRPRSGLAIKRYYRIEFSGNHWCRLSGEINVILVNLSAEEFVIEDGERIAQMVIAVMNRLNGKKWKCWTKRNVGQEDLVTQEPYKPECMKNY